MLMRYFAFAVKVDIEVPETINGLSESILNQLITAHHCLNVVYGGIN
jgi:hypothetical protein